MTDGMLVEQLRNGEAGALEALMDAYGGRVYRLARGITGDERDAEEVAQDVFLAVFQKIASFEGRAALGTWIFRMATNAALNKRRGKRREVETALDECLPAFEADGHRAGDRSYLLADWSTLPDEALLAGERRAWLSQALDALPARYRAVVILRDVEGLSNEEAAEALGESVSSVKSCLHRARMALREQLTRDYHDMVTSPPAQARA
ncbi:MAG: RNA polymerase sigma factor [Gammaproteobacteria bacterium]